MKGIRRLPEAEGSRKEANIQDIRGVAAQAATNEKQLRKQQKPPLQPGAGKGKLSDTRTEAGGSMDPRCNAMHQSKYPAPAGESRMVKLIRAQGGCLGTKSR